MPSLTCLATLAVIAFAFQSQSASAQNPMPQTTDDQSPPPAAPSMAESGLDRARGLIASHEQEICPLEIAVSKAWWKANTTGDDADFADKERAQNALDAALSQGAMFESLKVVRQMLRESNASALDPLTARQIDLLYLTYLEKQAPKELLQKITARANVIEKAFNVYRARVGGRELTDSEVKKVLTSSQDSAEREAVWLASKNVGPIVAGHLKALVLLRNELARHLGFANYHVMQLELNEQTQADVIALFDKLDDLTRGPFEAAKAEFDAKLAEQYGIDVTELRPWHYHDPFFQEAPAVFGTNLDAPFAAADIPKLCREFYAGLDLPIDDVLSRSDLYERPGKSPHAFCTDIDRAGDVRVLANIVPNEQWMSTMLHELGHAVYSSKNIPPTMPYVLRADAHILCTEGVAMMFERFSKSGDWLVAMGVDVPDVAAYNAAGARSRRDQLLIFSRWCQVMLRFEKGLYEDPDQDLNTLWWDLVEKYQGLKRPDTIPGRNAPDYAAKIHIVSAPCYYHNYMLGQLFACQVHRAIAREVLHAGDAPSAFYTKNPAVGRFMIDRVFAPGKSLSWNELTKHATGEPLSPEAFAAEFE